MTIDRQHGRIIISCDACGETIDSGKGEVFKDFWAEQKALGWSSKETSKTPAQSVWEHYCPNCKN